MENVFYYIEKENMEIEIISTVLVGNTLFHHAVEKNRKTIKFFIESKIEMYYINPVLDVC